ncbi:hypothetical protein [Halothiobacillus sp.]|jgi:hypothetical protein|uniref:hypothetical protein n=1 Tax=Halothiobacillus sp. TaxID=1891311 RepID=UPI002AD47CE9|nr:hypothetical protein [Halothiobacillus sp.]
MYFFRASLVAGLPALLAPVFVAFSFGFIDPAQLASPSWVAVSILLVGAYLILVTCIYALTRLLALLRVLSRASMMATSWLMALFLGFVLSYTPGSFPQSLATAGVFSVIVAAYSFPIIFLWWYLAKKNIVPSDSDA